MLGTRLQTGQSVNRTIAKIASFADHVIVDQKGRGIFWRRQPLSVSAAELVRRATRCSPQARHTAARSAPPVLSSSEMPPEAPLRATSNPPKRKDYPASSTGPGIQSLEMIDCGQFLDTEQPRPKNAMVPIQGSDLQRFSSFSMNDVVLSCIAKWNEHSYRVQAQSRGLSFC